MKDVYDALVAAEIGQADGDSDGLTDLEEVFIVHGFFADLNSNRSHDDGEEVGRTADGARPNRRNTPLVPAAYLLIRVVDEKGDPVTDGTLVFETTYARESGVPSWTYEMDLARVVEDGNLVYFAPAPPDREETVVISVRDHAGQVSAPWRIENPLYWQAVEGSDKDYALAHTFVLQSPSQ